MIPKRRMCEGMASFVITAGATLTRLANDTYFYFIKGTADYHVFINVWGEAIPEIILFIIGIILGFDFIFYLIRYNEQFKR